MAYNNRIPDISRIAQTVRDKDFIPITELKEFDAKLDEIIEKFSAVNNDTVSSQASNIGDLIKQIEYNMSDAIEFNPDGSIAGFKDVIDETSGATIPVNGENSYINLTDKLEEYYNEFMKLFGNDENSENWKNELTQYKENAIKAFKNHINGIFGRVAEQNAIESKEDGKDDYITSDPVKIKNNQIMRLNPDKHSFTRQITIMPQDVNKDIIAFEVGELEEKSLVLNMKVQNAKMFYNFNIVIDNGEVHITKEEHIKISDHIVNFKIHRYMSGSGKYMYVFVMNTDDPSTNVTYIIELTGILINGYSFGSSGQSPLDHKYYYAYYQVDNTSKPDYNEKYYVKSYDTSQVGLKTNYITYTVVTDSVPQEDETYYTSYTKDDGTIVYKEQKLLTQFEEGVIYYTRSITTESEGETVENQYVMIEYTNLREFDPDKEYFVKREEWKLIKEFAIESDTTSGIVDPTDKDIDDNTLFDDRNQVVVDGIKFADTLKYKNVDVECEELLGTTSDAEKALKGKEIVRLDDGVRFYKPYPGIISKVRRGAKKINGKLAISLGSKVADLFEIQPSQAIISTPIVEESIVNKTKDLIDLDLQLNEDDIYAADILEGKVNFYAFLKRISSDEYIESFGQTIHDEILFVNYFNIKFIGTIGDILDFQICADGNENYETCQHIFYNNKEKKVIFPVLRETADQLNTVINVKKRWKMLVSNQTYLFALSYDKEVWYSIDGGYHFKKHRKATKLGLVDIITDKKNFIGITEDGKTYFTTNGFDSYTQITFDGEEISPNRKEDDKIISLGEDLWYYIEDHKILELNREDSCWDILWESENECILKNLDFKTKGTQIDSNIMEPDDPYFVFATKNLERNSICLNKYKMNEKNFIKLIDYFDSKMNFDRIVTYQLIVTGLETNDILLVNIVDETDVNYTLNVIRFLYTHNDVEYITESNSNLIFIKTKIIEKINSNDKFVNNVYQNKDLIIQPFGTHTKGFSIIELEKNKIWVVTGDSDNGLYYSTDGKTWTQSNITSGSFNTVYYNNGIWVVTGDSDNGLYYSTDGKTWTQSNITSGSFLDVYYDNGIWVASSWSNNGLYYSLDDKSWTQSNITSGNFRAVYYDNGIWVACSWSDNGLYYSTDGKTWTQSNITSGNFLDVYYDNGIWVACSISDKGLYYSLDGKTWTQSNITSGNFRAVYYDNGIWVACSWSDKGLYYSLDGKTWTQSNITSGSFSDVYYDNGIWVATGNSDNGLYYSTDGKTWTQSNITSGNFREVYYDNGIWVAGGWSDKGLYYSTDGKTWTQSNITSGYFYSVYHGKTNTIYTVNIKYQDIISSLSINETNGENGLLFNGDFIPNLKVLNSKNIRLEIGDKKIESTNPLNDTTFETTEYPLNPDKMSEIYDKTKLFARTISGVGISEPEDQYNHQSEKEMIAFINPTIEAPIFLISKRETQSQFVVHNSILSIKDIVERGMNDMLIADSYDGSLQYDELSGLYTKNIVDNNDIMQYASTSEGVFAYGAGKGETYLVDWLKARVKTFTDLEVDGILECGVDKSIYIFPSNSNGVFKYDKVNKVIDRENIFPSLNNINCEYGFETSDGLFIVGTKNVVSIDGDTIEKSVIYFSPNKFDPETFSINGPASTEEQRVFKEILVTDVIDFCKPFGDEIVISTYDIDNPNVKYRFDRVSQTFKSVAVIDINHIYSFSYAEMYDGKIFVLNGTGSNPDVRKGFGVLNKTIYDSSSVGDDDRFYDIEILTPVDNINESESPSLFVHGGDLFGIVIETTSDEKSTCEVYAYVSQANTFVKMTSENSPLISAITSIANEEIKDIDENGHNVGYSASVQETADKTVEVVKNYDFTLENENYQIDKFYFDKENEGIILGNYTNGNNAFRIESNCMTFVTTESGNKSQIVIALPKENYLAIFNKSLKSLKTLSLRYKAIVNTTYHYVDVDSTRFTIKGIFGASDLTNNYVYVLIYGKFPILNQRGSNVTESQVSEDSYHLFRTTVDELLGSSSSGVLYEVNTPAHTITDIENYIRSQNLTLSDSIDYDTRNDYQLIGMKRDLLYKNIDSIAFWNTNSGSLDIISPLLWNNDIESDVNISGKNKEETYKDFIVFGDRNDKLYSFDAKSSVLREITKTGVESYAPIYRRGKNNFIGSSTSLNKIKNIEENPNINGCIDSIEFESIKDIEEGVNSSFATKKGLFASSYNNDDDVSYDKFKIVKSDNNIQKNLLTSNDSYKFQRVIDTRFGLFRWCITDSILSVDSRYNKYSVPAYYRYCYFNPNNKSKTITINPGNRSIIYGIWETLEGLFIGIKDYEYVSPDTIETFKLYYMKLIPNDIKLDFISINDERYFEEVDCNHMEVFDMKNTRYGLMIAAGGIGGNNGTNPTTDSSVSDSQLVEPPLGCIMLWNGETFVTVDSDFTFNDVVNGIYYPINIFDTSIGLFALCLKSVYDTEQKTYDKFSEAIYQYDNESESFVLYSELGEVKNKYVYLNKIFGSCTNRVFIETDIGPVYRSLSGIYDIKRKRIIKNIDNTNIESISIVRKYYESPDIYKSRNLYKIANHLHSRYDLPLDRFMKVFGSIMYNGLQVPVSALKIISRPGNNTEPFTVSFTIDKDARFTRNIDTIKALLEKKSEEGILSSINIGEITDWDIEKQKYIDHPINISKINIVVISDGITNERELEIEENYDFIMEQITSLKSQINDLIYQRSIISEGNNVIHTNIERSIDAKATSGRNLAVNLGFNINEDGCPLPKDGSEDLIKGFTEFIKAIRECEANDDYSKIYIGDYFVVPDFDGSVERFDVIGINTYNTNGALVGILVQSHYALGDGTTAWSDVIKRYQTIVSNFENMYNVELRPVKRWLGINTYTETSRLNNVKEAVALISENNTPSNNKFWTQKMFNLAEEEVGHPMNTNCTANSHSSCVIPLYARAPQYRVKRDHDGNPRHCWTDTFCAVATSSHEDKTLNAQTTGRCIVYGDRNIIVNDLGVSERAMVTGDTYAMDPYYSPCMYI